MHQGALLGEALIESQEYGWQISDKKGKFIDYIIKLFPLKLNLKASIIRCRINKKKLNDRFYFYKNFKTTQTWRNIPVTW